MSEALTKDETSKAANDKINQAVNESGGAPLPLENAKRPENLPEKFWDGEKKEIRAGAMTKSYLELERKLSSQGNQNLKEGQDEQDLPPPAEIMELTREIDSYLQAAGLSDEQKLAINNFGAQRIVPMVRQIASRIEAHSQIDRLTERFGGENKWLEIARQLNNWGKNKLSAKAFQSLASSYEGVLTLHRMMTTGEIEPELGRGGQAADGQLSMASLKEMMQNPRYWRDHDPVIVNNVREGFNRLYPSEG